MDYIESPQVSFKSKFGPVISYNNRLESKNSFYTWSRQSKCKDKHQIHFIKERIERII